MIFLWIFTKVWKIYLDKKNEDFFSIIQIVSKDYYKIKFIYLPLKMEEIKLSIIAYLEDGITKMSLKQVLKITKYANE